MLKKIFLLLLLFVIVIFIEYFNYNSSKKYKVLHISSYHPSFTWDMLMERGIKKGFADNGIEYNYKVVYMDSKTHNDPVFFMQKADEAIKLANEFRPDIIIVSDDNAASFVTKKLKNTKFKVVFCGVNANPAAYGLIAPNITGVREIAPVGKAVKLISLIKPRPKKIVAISEISATGDVVIEQLKELNKTSNIKIETFSSNSFEEWKKIISKAQKEADGIIIVTYFALKDKYDSPVNPADDISWIIQKSKLPEVGLRRLDSELGMLGVAAADEYSQGYIAANMASKILKGTNIESIPIRKDSPALIYINPQRAAALGLKVPSNLAKSFPGDKVIIGSSAMEAD